MTCQSRSKTKLADLPLPQQLLHWATVQPNEVALRQKEFGVWQPITWRQYAERSRAFGLGLLELGVKPGRDHRDHRRELPGMGLRATRRRHGRMHHGRRLPDLARRRGALPAGAVRGAGHRLRGPGADRQSARGARRAPASAGHHRHRSARPAPLRPQRTPRLRGGRGDGPQGHGDGSRPRSSCDGLAAARRHRPHGLHIGLYRPAEGGDDELARARHRGPRAELGTRLHTAAISSSPTCRSAMSPSRCSRSTYPCRAAHA